jgi:hypothetical protein
MKTGYAYEWEGSGQWRERTDDEGWDTVVYSPKGGETIAGPATIDGARCVVYLCPDGKFRAQTVAYLGS